MSRERNKRERKETFEAICSSRSWLNMWHDHYETLRSFCILLIYSICARLLCPFLLQWQDVNLCKFTTYIRCNANFSIQAQEKRKNENSWCVACVCLWASLRMKMFNSQLDIHFSAEFSKPRVNKSNSSNCKIFLQRTTEWMNRNILAHTAYVVLKTTIPNQKQQKKKKKKKKNLLFNSKHDHVLFLLAVKHCDDD